MKKSSIAIGAMFVLLFFFFASGDYSGTSPAPTRIDTNEILEDIKDLAPDAPKGDGTYIVGDEIRPGSWESDGSGDSCYWSKIDDDLDVIENHFGLAGETITIGPSIHAVQFRNCGTWTRRK